MCPLRQQQQQRIAQLMSAYKFTYVCVPLCVYVCVCVWVGGVYLLAFKLCQFWLTPVRQLVADAFVPQRQRERRKVGCQIRWLHIQKHYSQNYSRARFNQKNAHTDTLTHTQAMAPASMQQFLLSCDFSIFISIYVLSGFFSGFWLEKSVEFHTRFFNYSKFR